MSWYVNKLEIATLEDSSVGGIHDAARGLDDIARKVRGTYDDAASSWAGMAGHYQSPHTDLVTQAFPDTMLVYVDEATSALSTVAGAVRLFASTLVGLKSRYNTLNIDIHWHNQHPLDDLVAQSERAQRLENRKWPIISDVAAAEREARDAIEQVNLSIVVAKEAGLGRIHARAQDVLKFVKTWAAHAEKFDVASAVDVFSGKHVDPEQMILMFRAMDTTKMSADTGKQLQDVLTPALFQKVKDLFPKDPNAPQPPKTPVVSLPVNMDAKPGSMAQRLGDLTGTDGFKTFSAGLDKVGRAAAVVDTAVTYYDTYSTNYNESVLENPDWSAEQHRSEAVASAVIEGTAETVGKGVGTIVGQNVGRAAGAALGQALIPIPGVGAAVGGVVGGFVGGWAGEKIGGAIGKSVGDEMNEWRKNKDWGSAGDIAKATGEGVVDGGKALLKGVKGLFGFG